MSEPLVKLTLVYPLDVEDLVIETLLDLDPPIGGFTTHRVDGHGGGFDHATIGERVRGRTARAMLITILTAADSDRVLHALRAAARFGHGSWWIEPISDFGRL